MWPLKLKKTLMNLFMLAIKTFFKWFSKMTRTFLRRTCRDFWLGIYCLPDTRKWTRYFGCSGIRLPVLTLQRTGIFTVLWTKLYSLNCCSFSSSVSLSLYPALIFIDLLVMARCKISSDTAELFQSKKTRAAGAFVPLLEAQFSTADRCVTHKVSGAGAQENVFCLSIKKSPGAASVILVKATAHYNREQVIVKWSCCSREIN